MKHRLSATISIIVFLLVCFNVSISYAKDYEIMGQEAEDEGKLRQALTHYMSALESTSEESSRGLREKIIKLVQKIQPPPSVPEEALRYMGRGQAAFEIAKGHEDYKRAIDEFRKAVRLAPWLADGYYNLALVQEKAGDFDNAMRSFKLYILAAPSATDTEEVKTRIYGLEYKAEQQQEKERAKEAKLNRKRAERKRQEEFAFLLGTWDMERITIDPPSFGGDISLRFWGTFTLSKRGPIIEGYAKGTRLQALKSTTPNRISPVNQTEQVVLRGTLKGSAPTEIRWEVKTEEMPPEVGYCPEWGGWRTANILIGTDKRRISFRIPKPVYHPDSGCREGGYAEYILTR